MFDIMKVARNIKEARIARDMTQMNLADAMEVSYQAVSNWERGNSMPDIAKLEQLCQVLEISIDQLLGSGNETETITKIIHRDEDVRTAVTMEEIGSIAPLLSPREVKKLVKVNLQESSEQENSSKEDCGRDEVSSEKKKKKMIISLAPYLGSKDLDELMQELEGEGDMKTIKEIAPFLGQRSVDQLAMRLADGSNLKNIRWLLPFLSQECMEELLELCGEDTYMESLRVLAPFLSSKFLKELIGRAED